MSLKQLLQQDRRLVMLRILKESAGYTANESILDAGLDAYGHKVSRDIVNNELAWLAEMDLITLDNLADTNIAKITQRGIDVAEGQANVQGVKRPKP